MKDIFVYNLLDLENLMVDYSLEFCGISGRYYPFQWYVDTEAGVNVYFHDNGEYIQSNIYDKYLNEY